MKTLLAIILSLFFSQVSIAQSPETKTIPITPSYVIPTKNDPIIINLESASLDSPYTGNEVIEIYNANGTPVTPSQFNHCSLNRCGRSFPNNRPESLLINDLPKYPLIISTNPNTKQGIYTIAVRDSSSKKIIHRRTLTLIAPAPDLKSFKVEYSNGTSSSNKLIIPESQSLAGTKFIFEGLSLDQDFESIKLGDLRLTKMSKPELSNVFVADKSWSVLNLKKLDISNLKIYIKQFNVSKPYERQILVEAPLPIIGRIDPIPLNPGTRSFNLNLSISNLFENAQIRLTEVNKQDILRLEGTLDGAISNPQANQLTYRIELNDGALNSGISTFMVQIVNPDGNTSEPKIVQIEVQKASIIASPMKETLPFVESIQAQVKFTRG